MKSKKDKIIQVRISEQEYESLKIALKPSGLSISDYLRNAMQDISIETINHDKEIMKSICHIYQLINQSEPSEIERNIASEELNQLCQLLKQ